MEQQRVRVFFFLCVFVVCGLKSLTVWNATLQFWLIILVCLILNFFIANDYKCNHLRRYTYIYTRLFVESLFDFLCIFFCCYIYSRLLDLIFVWLHVLFSKKKLLYITDVFCVILVYIMQNECQWKVELWQYLKLH